MARGFIKAVIGIGVACRENVDEVMKVMRAAAHTVREDADLDPRILDEMAIAGVDSWGDSAGVFQYRFHYRPRVQRGIRHAPSGV
ncbi:hypothetical protein [Hydrogenophaga sp.]|uniref:hypothetical protein n=1 Tax=Hydrogenophaga sp. TaxID=1904254 RepID=UPI002721875F|nr:hypothetical protein [Hydrogenophaga sp.]MDO9606450.1 hypothetical protein [Hydrogenophaga sp.]